MMSYKNLFRKKIAVTYGTVQFNESIGEKIRRGRNHEH